MMGLEPTTFCMEIAANVRAGSLAFAEPARLRRFRRRSERRSERERMSGVATVATLSAVVAARFVRPVAIDGDVILIPVASDDRRGLVGVYAAFLSSVARELEREHPPREVEVRRRR